MKDIIFGIVGGLGLFIFGMRFLSEGLQKVAGTKLRRLLRSLTGNPFKGIATGTLVTGLIQSSSATTIILVGLINAGIISLAQSASVVVGANIGTTITAQIIAFKISQYALPAIGLGLFMMLFSRRMKTQFWGQVILALGILFLGLSIMSGVAKPLKDISAVHNFFAQCSQKPLLGILAGTIFTSLVQSSSASVGMLIALSGAGLIDFQAAIYILLGNNIGTTVTAWLASIGGTLSAKRMACFHTIFNIIGVVYFGFLTYWGIFPKVVDWITPGVINTDTIARNIANAHTLFNVVNALVFIPIIGITSKFIKHIISGEDAYISGEMKYLQDKLLATPHLAIDAAKKEIAYMAGMAKKVFALAVTSFFEENKKTIQHIKTTEDAIDNIQHDITFYLAKLSTDALTLNISEQLPPLLHTINDIERISDHAVNVGELIERIVSEKVKFSNNAIAEMRTIYGKIEEMFENVIPAILTSDENCAKRVLVLEGEVNRIHVKFFDEHTKRLCEKKCEPLSAMIYVDFINNLEKVADHLTNIAQAALGQFSYDKVKKADFAVLEKNSAFKT
ncbi:MAG: Na/Pi cotransporter family protein [Candidatus Omnitrophica bacterium]|nr:Na/Pi cotransporter family protein [Candidatus Omnitrophota bacterium]